MGPARSGLVPMECGPQTVVQPAVGCVGSRTWFSDKSSRLFAQCPSGVNPVVLFPSRIEEDAYGSILHGLQERPQGDVAHGLRIGGREAPAQRLFSRTRSSVEGLKLASCRQLAWEPFLGLPPPPPRLRCRSRPSQVKGCDVDRPRSPVLRRLDLDSSNGRRPVGGRHPHHGRQRRERSCDRRRPRRRQGTQVACT